MLDTLQALQEHLLNDWIQQIPCNVWKNSIHVWWFEFDSAYWASIKQCDWEPTTKWEPSDTSCCWDQITWPTVGFMGNSWEGWQRDWIVTFCGQLYAHLVLFTLVTKSYFSAILFLWLFTNPSFFHSYVTSKWLHCQKNQSNMQVLCSREPSWRNYNASDKIQKNMCCSIFITVRKQTQYKWSQIEKWINKPIGLTLKRV